MNKIQPQLDPKFVARSLGISPSFGDAKEIQAPPFTAVVTDSRKVIPGCLFVGLKGDQFDGNDFIHQAILQGATGILFKEGSHFPPPPKNIFLFPVQDPLMAFRKLAHSWRKQFSIPIIAIAGSVGKTTTKEILACILSGKWNSILKTQGSQNGFIGIPITLLNLRPFHEAAIIEIGIDEIGAMKQHMELVSPTASVLTAIGPEHLEKLRDIPTVAFEEGIALSYVSQNGGTIFINKDDPWISPFLNQSTNGRRISYTLKSRTSSDREPSPEDEAHPETLTGQIHTDQESIRVYGVGLRPTSLRLPLLGEHNARNLLAAVSIAASFGLNPDEIKKGLSHFKGAEGRSEIRELPGETYVICDYYNAQPASMTAGLDLLAQLSRTRQGDFHKMSLNSSESFSQGNTSARWVCLGDMLELGSQEEQFHRNIATQIMELEIENVLLFGQLMGFLADELEKRGFQGHYAHFLSQTDLGEALTQKIKKGDTLLIKGSRGMRMETIWKVLESYANEHWKTKS